MPVDIKTIIVALLYGLIPAIFWLLFWLREDRKRPEPKGRIFLAFLSGMIAVFLVIPIERYLISNVFGASLSAISLGVIISWALVEELFKYVAAYLSALRSSVVDEPIDPIIYLITVALGFAAMENTLFILGPIQDGLFLQGLITGNMRFIGATLLHVVSSGTVGAALSFSFYRKRVIKKEYTLVGLILAVLLHSLFNFFIMKSTDLGVFAVFFGVWLLAILIIVLFERIKRIRRKI
jgi:RsiW-degrading membrane proteinase PrsW (M82 family)